MLTVVNIHHKPSSPPGDPNESYESDELFTELESQLGASEAEFVKIQLSYRHSGLDPLSEGVSSCSTRLATVAVSVVQLHGPVSTWCPRNNIYQPLENVMFPTIAAHWGPIRTNDLLKKRILPTIENRIPLAPSSTTSSRKTAKNSKPKRPSSPDLSIQVPRRRTSLNHTAVSEGDHTSDIDPARRIWTQIRHASTLTAHTQASPDSTPRAVQSGPPSLLFDQAHEPQRLANVTNNLRHYRENYKNENKKPAKTVVHRRQLLRDTALRNKRSIGADSLRSLVPSLLEENSNNISGEYE